MVSIWYKVKFLLHSHSHVVVSGIDPRTSAALPVFHAFTGCDTVSRFEGRGKKTAWKVWEVFPDVTEAFEHFLLVENDIIESAHLKHRNPVVNFAVDAKNGCNICCKCVKAALTCTPLLYARYLNRFITINDKSRLRLYFNLIYVVFKKNWVIDKKDGNFGMEVDLSLKILVILAALI